MYDSTQLTASSSDLVAALQLSMRAVQHENVDVRVHALTSLRDMMHSKQVNKHTHTQFARQLPLNGVQAFCLQIKIEFFLYFIAGQLFKLP